MNSNNQISNCIKITAVIPLLLLWCTTAVHSQNSAKIDTGTVYKLGEIIVSASKMEENPSSVGRNVTVISNNEIRASQHRSVGGLLDEQLSLHIIGNRQAPGSIQSMFLRNANSYHSVVMLNGVRVSDPSTVNNSIDLSELSLANVERIEIVRGSHSTLYGSSAIGGVVNIITKGRGQNGLSGMLNTTHGTYEGAYVTENRLNTGYALDNGFYVNLGIAQEWTGGMDATVDTVGSTQYKTTDDDAFRKLDVSGKAGYQKNGLDIFLSYRNEDSKSELDQGAFNDDDNAEISFNRDLINYKAAYQLYDRFEISYSGGYSEIRRDFVNDSSIVDQAGNYDGVYTETDATGSLWENELTAKFESEIADITGGVNRTRQTMNTRTLTFVRPFNFEQVTDLDSLDLRETITGGFLHAEIKGGSFSSTLERVSLVIGSRYLFHNEFGSHVTYEINPEYRISNQSMVYASLTTGFNAPSLFQLNSPSMGFGAFTSRGNENLEPETSVSYELGLKQSLGGSTNLNISLFRTRTSNVIEFVYLWNQNTSIDNLTFADFLGDTYINLSEQTVDGIEVGFESTIIPDLRISGNLSYTNSSFTISPADIDESYTGGHHVQVFESGEFVDRERQIDGLTRRPSINAEAGIRYRPGNQFSVGVQTSIVGNKDDLFFSSSLGPIGALGRTEVDSYTVTDLTMKYDLARNLKLMARVENVFNADYTEIQGFRTRGRGLYGSIEYTF